MSKTKTEKFQKMLESANILHNVVKYPHCTKIAIHTTIIGSNTIKKLYFVGFESLSIGTDLKGQEHFVLNY